ncbi:MotA/TolQ/ExbB proton channel family protein [Pseudoalteromonas denitrificans]|uniref:MotA/TolQ/ExbB proton channel family protein n=1 Tax=Pseudoalteromonas denitrificans DSM 6059 TaxID=1123010 RepID=A0A1I1Q3M7_9GAMM|nr:MotA/TolQ/ExbB proton channel family protein [Pseudoalteromonas denitrificans]SFD12740.1 MotA/TolQ/ExbB proton channel family protein [Pseudoalteromonas denitrificans DSM 6059]
MNIQIIESLMANVSEILMTPVLVSILVLFIYAIYTLGRFVSQYLIRKKNGLAYFKNIKNKTAQQLTGYPIHNYFVKNPNASEDEIEVYALKKLETLRIVTRVAPMLGLIATMIPMGPALKSLADGNIQGISENLIIAFAAVIWGLVISTITFWPASVKKRWFADEIINIRKFKGE